MRKVASSLALLGLSAMILTACGSGGGKETPSSGGAGESETPNSSMSSIELWMPPNSSTDVSDAEAWAAILAPFEEEHGVTINTTIVPWASYEEKFLTGAASGDGADVGYMYTEMIGDYISRGQLTSFDDYMTAEQKDSYLYLDLGVSDGKQWSIPFVVGNARVLYYNKAILEEAGVTDPPATWDEFRDAAKKVADGGKTAILMPWGDPARGVMNSIWFPLVWQAGGELFNADGTATDFASEQTKRAAEFVLSLQADGSVPESATGLTNDQAEEAFANGEGAFLWDGTNQYETLSERGVDVGVIYSLKDETEGTFVAADSLVMFDACADKQLCADLVAYITSTPAMEKFHENAQFPPITKDEEYEGPEVFQTLYTEREDLFRSLPPIMNSTAAYNTLYTNLQQMVLGQKSVDQALTDAAAEGDAALTQ